MLSAGRVRAACTLVLGSPAESSAASAALVSVLRTETMSDGVGVVRHSPAALQQMFGSHPGASADTHDLWAAWFVEVVRELSHNRSLNDALFEVWRRVGTSEPPPVLVAYGLRLRPGRARRRRRGRGATDRAVPEPGAPDVAPPRAGSFGAADEGAGITITPEALVRDRLDNLGARTVFDAAIVLNRATGVHGGLVIDGERATRFRLPEEIKEAADKFDEVLERIANNPNRYPAELGGANVELLVELAQYGGPLFKKVRSPNALGDRKSPDRLQVVTVDPDTRRPIEFFYDHMTPRPGATLCPNFAGGQTPAQCADYAALRKKVKGRLVVADRDLKRPTALTKDEWAKFQERSEQTPLYHQYTVLDD